MCRSARAYRGADCAAVAALLFGSFFATNACVGGGPGGRCYRPADRDGDGCTSSLEPEEGGWLPDSIECADGYVPWSQLPPNGDCDDADATVCLPAEVCGDGIDNDCDGYLDEEDPEGCAEPDDDSDDDDSARASARAESASR
jgi:hypothetical protein